MKPLAFPMKPRAFRIQPRAFRMKLSWRRTPANRALP